jgi:hypothetical protein
MMVWAWLEPFLCHLVFFVANGLRGDPLESSRNPKKFQARRFKLFLGP